MFRFLVKLVLKFEAGVVSFDRAKSFDEGTYPGINVPLAEFFRGNGAVAGIVIRKTRVPPDASVDVFGKLDAALVGAGFLFGAVQVDKIGMRDQRIGSFVSPA